MKLLTYKMQYDDMELAESLLIEQIRRDMHSGKLTLSAYESYLKELEVYWGALEIIKRARLVVENLDSRINITNFRQIL